jgi:hypothetical protein
VPRKTQKIERKKAMIRTRGQADFFYAMQKCENVKNSMRCKKAKNFASYCIAFFFKKKTGKIIDRTLFRIRIRIALPALSCILV